LQHVEIELRGALDTQALCRVLGVVSLFCSELQSLKYEAGNGGRKRLRLSCELPERVAAHVVERLRRLVDLDAALLGSPGEGLPCEGLEA